MTDDPRKRAILYQASQDLIEGIGGAEKLADTELCRKTYVFLLNVMQVIDNSPIYIETYPTERVEGDAP